MKKVLIMDVLEETRLKYERERNKLKKIFMEHKPGQNASELIANYNKEKSTLRQYNCKDTFEMIDYISSIDMMLYELNSIISLKKLQNG